MSQLKKVTASIGSTRLVGDASGSDANTQSVVAMPSMSAPSASGVPQPKVAILLCSHNGQHYLEEQLDSIAAQFHKNWEVWASDDGSKDATLALLEARQRSWPSGRLSINAGPVKGFAANFLSLTCHADICADYYAYSDQDDIWEPNKLARAVKWLETVPENVPALYCSRTCLIDINNEEIGLSPLFIKPPSFANALIQNIGGGNTMVFNNCARQLLIDAGMSTPIISHDWWAYMLITGCGGKVFYDSQPMVRYRQHANNLVGANSTWLARMKRIQKLWNGRFRLWNDVNIQALQKVYGKLTPEAQQILDGFALARERPLITRLIGVKRSGIYRQTLLGNLGLAVAVLLKKI